MITIISGTNRKGGNSLKVSKFYQAILKEKGLNSQVLDLCALPVDFVKNMYGNHTTEVTKIIKENIADVSKFIFVIPEYNGSYSGAVKLFMDGISPSFFNHKSAMLVGVASGRAGNIVGLEQFTTVLNHLKVEVLSNKVLISQVDTLLDESGMINNTVSIGVIEEQIDTFKRIHNL